MVSAVLEIEPTGTCVNVGKQLNKIQLDQLQAVISTHGEAFSIRGELGLTKLIEHSIDLLDNKPIVEPMKRHPRTHAIEMQRQVKEMLDKGVIEPSNSSVIRHSS